MRLLGESPQWYGYRVRSRHEKLVSRSLRTKAYEEFLPLTRCRRGWVDRVKVVEIPLFPGYIFCRSNEREIGRIRSTVGIIDVVRAGSSPVPVRTEEIESLRQAVRHELPMESYPTPDELSGRCVRITSGPLSGMSGVLTDVRGRQRLVLSVDLLRRSVLVELPAACVEVLSHKPTMRSCCIEEEYLADSA
jgi:transcription antitermination factor NusG